MVYSNLKAFSLDVQLFILLSNKIILHEMIKYLQCKLLGHHIYYINRQKHPLSLQKLPFPI